MGTNGRPEARVKGYVSLPLNKGYSVLVDRKDLTWIKGFQWYVHDTGRNLYVRTSFPRKLYMHEILAGLHADHINGNTLDNRRQNLRKATKRENAANSKKREGTTSPYKGVHWDTRRRCWIVQVGGRYIGGYESAEVAAGVYDAEALKEFGEFARLNFPVQEISDGQF